MIGAKALARLDVLDHEVGEASHVAAGDQHRRRRQHRAVDLEHLLLEYEVSAPLVDQIGLHCAAHRTVVVQAVDSAVDGERLVVEEASLEQVLELWPIDLALLGLKLLDLGIKCVLARLQLSHRTCYVQLGRLLGLQLLDQFTLCMCVCVCKFEMMSCLKTNFIKMLS